MHIVFTDSSDLSYHWAHGFSCTVDGLGSSIWALTSTKALLSSLQTLHYYYLLRIVVGPHQTYNSPSNTPWLFHPRAHLPQVTWAWKSPNDA